MRNLVEYLKRKYKRNQLTREEIAHEMLLAPGMVKLILKDGRLKSQSICDVVNAIESLTENALPVDLGI